MFKCVTYYFCLNLPEKFSQPGDHFLAQPCIDVINYSLNWEQKLADYPHCRDLTKEIRGLSNVEQVLLDTADSVMDTKRKVEFGVQQIIFKVGQ